eukprot:NODE_5599_length_993_cov_33.908046_g5023_i0.p1 GENE.NODE_5599_length_993_cov_33.908046_g5023_i0~~NODE_5599_length_993_cov_33.908046_g5023_i0.p1  ORF type:complete len:300 (+),score=52.12 NODE_5599_length_993_cov_33.908046_g5023_i0:70-900(+)
MNLRSGNQKEPLAKYLVRFKAVSRKDAYTGDFDEDWKPEGYRKRILSSYMENRDENELCTTIEKWKKRKQNDGTKISDITTWKDLVDSSPFATETRYFKFNSKLNEKISIYQGGVTDLQVDAIVNAANSRCLGGGGVDGAVHSKAGRLLVLECAAYPGCATGESLITKGYKLPSRYVIHTVGPIGEDPTILEKCYVNSLTLASKFSLRSLAFCMISTGIFGYPLDEATHVALATIRKWMEANPNLIDRIIFACYLPHEYDTYLELMPSYFPKDNES